MNDDRFDDEEMMEDEGSFAELFEASLSDVGQPLERGKKIEATILQIGKDWTFLDVGQKGEGVLSSAELLDADGEPQYNVGDVIGAYFVSREGGELRFTTKVGGSGSGTEQLEEAFQSGIPVEGKIEKEIKGGFEVKLPGNVRAFCPYSQTGLRQAEPADLIGESLSFRITQFSERGRNIVVSHRAILDEEREQQRASLKETLKEGMVVKGSVTNIRDFGAFVDIGGIEGLLPISEISYGRVEDVNDILSIGQELEIAIKKIDWENNKFSFSLRDTLADPWSKVGSIYKTGGKYSGKVSRLAQFGAFVTLEDGVDGLLHISKLGQGQRIRHPQDVVTVGQSLEVMIEKVEPEERRISLALVGAEAEEAGETSYSDAPSSSSASGFGSLGDLLKASQEKKGRKGKKRK
ncbi:SSU ribosomal protein S1P [Malonomonas rubra DSM 5091]|uniref:SSU ribosomal protein S1P n=1 Tax=Malonomonas rubra DSM 5091 TaxID=1122189 RepID=A0A1M6MQ45_MALRU|nr:30S ribosomal protein S1 [Malonomonas rubra]SHJ85562.1 SSU ribosomal protein S1P [Malonomonas rubra DSM 5091]